MREARGTKLVDRRLELMKLRKHLVQSKNNNGWEDMESHANIINRIWLHLSSNFSILIIMRFFFVTFCISSTCSLSLQSFLLSYLKHIPSCFRYLFGVSF